MVVSISPTDRAHHKNDAMHTLRQLVSCESEEDNVAFCFDVPLHRFTVVARPSETEIVTTGELSLAIYNDLKLSQYILEDDNLTTREKRRFSLTSRGRQMAAMARH